MEGAAISFAAAPSTSSCILSHISQRRWNAGQLSSFDNRLGVKKKWKQQLRNALCVKAKDETAVSIRKKFKMNFNEYLVTLDKPLGIRFAQTLSGRVYVEALAKKGNADNSQLVIVGDVVKKAVFDNVSFDVDDFGHVMNSIRTKNGPIALVLERSVFPLHIQTRIMESDVDTSFNYGHVAIATWNNNNLSSPNQSSPDTQYSGGNVGFVMYAWKFLLPRGLKELTSFAKEAFTGVRDTLDEEEEVDEEEEDEEEDEERSDAAVEEEFRGNAYQNTEASFEIIATYTDEEDEDGVEWTHGNYSVEEYSNAQARAAGDLSYNHHFGMKYTKMTEHVYLGSCIQSASDVQVLKQMGITAVINLQSESEQMNWGLDRNSIRDSANANNIIISNCPIRDVDTVDLRRKLPFAVGMLYRLLRLGHHVYITCTSGMDRSPACIIGYLHWIQDLPLQEAVDYVTNLHPSGPDRPALVWATWDLIGMAEEGKNHKGPATHAVVFVWNHGCKEGEEVLIVGDFKGGWNEPVKASHVSGPKYTVDLRLPQGKYQYKFIVGGQWRHSSSLPTEIDRWGNVNNVIIVGGVASVKFDKPIHCPTKDLTSVRVIERVLSEDERFTLTFAARKMAFSICPLRFIPK